VPNTPRQAYERTGLMTCNRANTYSRQRAAVARQVDVDAAKLAEQLFGMCLQHLNGWQNRCFDEQPYQTFQMSLSAVFHGCPEGVCCDSLLTAREKYWT
jgi:hypothetical protein